MASTFLTANAILFSINSAVKLSYRFRKAYADSIKSKQIVLPLPTFAGRINETDINFFFEEEGKHYVQEIKHLELLHQKAKVSHFQEGSDELEDYRRYYRTFVRNRRERMAGGREKEDAAITREEAIPLFQLWQWETGRVEPQSTLQLVAGSLVEIGIDYFNQVPGALNLKSSYGKAIRSFLVAIDDINFATAKNLKASVTQELVPRFFASAAETIRELSPEITSDENLQKLIQATSSGIANDIYERLGESPSFEQTEEAIQWGQLVLRSMIKNAGSHTFTNAAELFGTQEAATQLVKSTGSALLKAILDSSPAGIDFKEIFTVDNIDSILKAAFTTISEFPELVSGEEELINIITGVSTAMAESGIQRPGLIPEFVRLVFEKTAQNLDAFWDQSNLSPQDNLLITGLKDILGALTLSPEEGVWKPNLSNTQLLGIVHNLTDEIVRNPNWIKEKIKEKSVLSIIVNTTLNQLATVPPINRFSMDTLGAVIQLNLKAVASSPQLLQEIHWGTDQEEVMIFEKAIDLIFSFTLKGNQLPGISRLGLLADLMEFSLDTILRQHPDKKGLLLVRMLLFDDVGIDYSKGFDHEMGLQLINSALVILDDHIELVTEDHLFSAIISDTAAAVRSTVGDQQDIIPEVVRLVFENTAGHLDFLLKKENDRYVHLLVIGLQGFLQAVSQPAVDGNSWKPTFTNYQLLELIDVIFVEVMNNPEWGRQEKQIFDFVKALFDTMEKLPEGQTLPHVIVRNLMENAFQATSKQGELKMMLQTDTGEKQLAISYSLERFFIVLYDEENNKRLSWNLNQVEVLDTLLEYFLSSLAAGPGSKDAIDKELGRFKQAVQSYEQQLIVTIDDLLEELTVGNLAA